MKKIYTFLTLALLTSPLCQAQDIPMFSQKLTNSFIYNPAVAGNNVGSLTYSYRMSYGGIANAPKTHFVSMHTPLAGHKIGIGVNFYQEDVNFIKNSYAAVAFAYHLRMGKYSSLSFGLSGEYNFMRLNGTSNSDILDPAYLSLANGDLNDYDFSFGMVYQNKYMKAGVSANRLATAWIKEESQFILSSFYSGFLQGTIPLRNGDDLLEPVLIYRKFSETNSALDVGLYYTYNNFIMAGASMRQGDIVGVTAGVHVTPKLLIGYTREMFYGEVRNQAGSTNEFTLRFDFNKYDYRATFSDNYKSSLAYRRKTMSGYKGSKSPSQMHRQQKKLASYSPNKRYQSTKKLSVTPSSQRYKVKSNRYKPPKKRKPKRK